MGKNYIHMFVRTEVLVYAKGIICLSIATLFAPKLQESRPSEHFQWLLAFCFWCFRRSDHIRCSVSFVIFVIYKRILCSCQDEY